MANYEKSIESIDNWTTQYVVSHRNECLSYLRTYNQLVIRYLQQDDFYKAYVGLNTLLDGLVVMQNGRCGDFRSELAMFSMAKGIVLASMGPRAVPKAIEAFEAARDYAKSAGTKQSIEEQISEVRSGNPLASMPHVDISDALIDEVLKKLDRELASAISGSKSNHFADWDEEDLEWAYKRIKFRRNIYGILCIFPPLGVILLPFWLRAVYLTKAIRDRDSNVDFNIFTKIVLFIYGLPTFFIYPIIMGQIIKWTNWGMGLRDRKALIPTFALLALVVFLIIRPYGISFPDFSGLANFFNRTSVSDTEQTEPPAEETPDASVDVQPYQDSGFIFPNSDTELIVQQEVENLSDSDLTYAINEIYARHGYLFRSDELRGYYEQFSWYTGRISPDEFSVDLFNRIEQQNWNMLVNERNRRTSSD